jgi:hypothetical protein
MRQNKKTSATAIREVLQFYFAAAEFNVHYGQFAATISGDDETRAATNLATKKDAARDVETQRHSN